MVRTPLASARIHRLTLGILRKQIQPVTPAAVHALVVALAARRAAERKS